MSDFFALMCIVGLIMSLVIYIIAERSKDVQEKIFFGKFSSLLFFIILQFSLAMLHLDATNLFFVMRGVIAVFIVRDTYVLFKDKIV